MLNRLLRLLPQTLLERVYALYGVSLLTFILAGLGFFYYNQFNEYINDAHESAQLLTEVIAPTIADSAVIGDYDTVNRTLEKVLFRSVYASAMFIDLRGGVMRAETRRVESVSAPAWLQLMVMRRLSEVNRVISVGGRDYGVLRLQFSPTYIAAEIWKVTRGALIISTACLVLGIVVIRIPLRRWLGNLDRLRDHEWMFQDGASLPRELLGADAPLEIRQTFDLLNRTAMNLQVQRARADVTLGAIAEGVITLDSQRNIVYANPVAVRLFQGETQSLLGQNVKAALPEPVCVLLDSLERDAKGSARIELGDGANEARIIECNWKSIIATPDTTAGYVLTCRDVTDAHRLENKLHNELASRRTALDSLRNVVQGLQGRDDIQPMDNDDIQTMSKFIADLSRERTRVTALLENSVKELGYQKSALDAHAIVTITDRLGTITYANEKFTEISGYSSAELIGQNHSMMKSGLHSREFYTDLWRTISEGRVWHGQFANRAKSGEIYWAESTIVPWLDGNGLPYQYIAIRTDISVQKRNAQALAEARQRELEIGTSIQRSLLKDEVPDGIQGAWLASFTEPSQGIDGDFYAIRRFHSDCFEILVGDVMGKGVPAALIGAAIKTSYNQTLADLLVERAGDKALPEPAAIVNRLHHALTQRLIDLASFATLALYRFDLQAGTLTYVIAGHTPGLLTRASDARTIELLGDNLPIGVVAEEQYVQLTVPIVPGDSLLVFSDGITETRSASGEEFGFGRLAALVDTGRKSALPPATLLHSVRQELRRFAGNSRLLDDQTALMVELRPQRRLPRMGIEQRVNPYLFNMAWNFEALQTLRQRIEESAWFLPESDAHALILASFEAATNIIRHAPPLVADATLTCRVARQDEALVVELIYPSEAFTPPAQTRVDFSGESEGGFGLYIIERSVDSVEYGEPMPGLGSIRLIKRASRPAAQVHGAA